MFEIFRSHRREKTEKTQTRSVYLKFHKVSIYNGCPNSLIIYSSQKRSLYKINVRPNQNQKSLVILLYRF